MRVAGLYAVGGWAVFQVMNGLLPALGFAPWTVSLAALLFLSGFPIAVVLAWMFEITPEGIRLVPGDRRKFGAGQYGWIDWLIGTVVAAAFAFAVVQLANVRQRIGEQVESALGGTPAKSVAVLPFASYSEVPGDGYFADGLTEELINSLAQSPELKVAGRTSAFYFKGRNLDLREIGRKLGVAHVVEGSVRRVGERMRVTAQLISVKTGYHLWSKTYDRTVDDALAIQTEVAEAVADSLKTQLVGPAKAAPAESPDDYRLALSARARLRTQDREEVREARRIFSELRIRNPGNAAAHAGYAHATILLAQNFIALPFPEARREAEQAVAQALRVDPRSVEAWLAKGALERALSIRSGDGTHHSKALAAFRKAYELDPRNPETMILLAKQLLTEGQPDQAVALLRTALVTDPLSRTGQEVLANALAALGQFDVAHRSFESLLALYPDDTSAVSAFAEMLIFKQGRLDEAARLLDDRKLAAEDPLNAIMLASALANLGVPGGPQDAIDRIPADSEARPIAQAALLQLAGRSDELLDLAAERAPAGDPVWGSLQVVESALIGEYHASRAAMPANFPGLFEDPPALAGYRDIDATISAWSLMRSGEAAKGRAILEGVLRRLTAAGSKAPDQLVLKGMALSALGRTGEAVSAFEAAYRAGWRTPIEFDYFVRITDYPFMAETARDQRFRKVLAAIEADNGVMRERFLATRRGAAGAPVH